MSEDTFELSPSQRTAMGDFIAEVAADTGYCDFVAEENTDVELVVLALLAADSAEVENIGEFFAEQFGLEGIAGESLADFLAGAWAERIDGQIRIAGGGPN